MQHRCSFRVNYDNYDNYTRHRHGEATVVAESEGGPG